VFKSKATGMSFPTAWNVQIPELQLAVSLQATMADQEFITLGGKPSYWEGRVDVRGTIGSAPMTGLGFLECHVKQDAAAVKVAFEMMSMMLLTPLKATNPLLLLPPTAVSAPLSSATLTLLADTVAAPIVEQAAMMLAMAGEQPMSADHKKLLRSFLAAYAVATHRPLDAMTAAGFAEEQWLAAATAAAPDFRLIILRAFMHFGLQSAIAGAAAAAPANSASMTLPSSDGRIDRSSCAPTQAPYPRPSDAEYAVPAGADAFTSFATSISGTWIYDKPRNTDKISDFLGAQGVGLVARTMCGAVTPTLKTAAGAEPLTISTTILTGVSNSVMTFRLDGKAWTWNSFGRGDVAARAKLVHAASMVVETVLPADQSVELKWLTVSKDGGELAEYMEYHKTRGAAARGEPPVATFRQYFKKAA
jgi:hypothetical protein